MSRHGFELKTNEQIILMRQAGLATAAGLDAIRKLIRAGITTLELDKAADDAIRAHGGHSNFQLVEGYKHTICASVNDEVVHGKGSLLGKMPGDDWQKFANLRAYYGFMWGYPGKKLLFMGNEFGQENEWRHDHSLDWHLLEQPPHAGVQALVRDLNRLYRTGFTYQKAGVNNSFAIAGLLACQ